VVDDPFLEIFTDGQTVFTDSNNRNFTVSNGVLYVDDLTITSGSTLRGRGKNPLVIYATGRVVIDGTLTVEGNHSHWPTGLNSPQFPEGGAAGECGGGTGGDASQITNAETPRGEAGDGPFGVPLAGGGGGEGGFQQKEFLGGGDYAQGRMMAAGGAGGTFALTPNESILWKKWAGKERPPGFDNIGPDHVETRHPEFDPSLVLGGEDGMRGSSFESNKDPLDSRPSGIFGMEDESADRTTYDGTDSDPGSAITWKNEYIDAPFDDRFDNFPENSSFFAGMAPEDIYEVWANGHPVFGPDPGRSNAGPFLQGDALGTANDFWGRRLTPEGGVIVGELLSPWAGYGGGASGDSQVLRRLESGVYLPLDSIFPDRPWNVTGGPKTDVYRKGAPGGGGGGQLLIMAIGEIKLGANSKLSANGGIGHGGESVIFDYNQVSGSGGGSGGHLVIHSATGLDLSEINLSEDPGTGDPVPLDTIVQARGGRRGWCSSIVNTRGQSGVRDGNSDFMLGRGGAGGNGVIQIHVPDPGTDIKWHPDWAVRFDIYIHGGIGGTHLDIDRVEEILDLYTTPRPYVLIPFFSSGSQIASTWIDTGLAYLRNPNGGPDDDYPKWANSLLQFDGIDLADGQVLKSGTRVAALPNVVEAPAASASFQAFEVTVTGAAALFAPHFLRHPQVLVGYDVLPNLADPNVTFEIVAAEYDRSRDVMTLHTRSSDGAMTVFVGASWAVRPKFFRIATSGVKDFLPASTEVFLEFQGADDPDDPATYKPEPGNVVAWSSDLSLLEGCRFLRWRMTFDIDAQDQGVGLTSPRPEVDYLKIPFVW